MTRAVPKPLILHGGHALTCLPAALLLALPVLAQQQSRLEPDEMRRDLYTLENSSSIGLGWVSAENRRWGQYRGLASHGTHLLLDLNLMQREESTGTWLKLMGRNTGVGSREVSVLNERQGDWAWWLQGVQMTRREPLVVNSGLQGLGGGSQIVSAAAPRRDFDLQVGHDILGAGVRSFLLGGVEVQASLRQDESRGDRMMGRGTSNVIEFLTEPIDRVTRSWQLLASYRSKTAQFSGGYSGSSFDNRVPLLHSTGGNTASFGSAWDIALAPDNSTQQVHFAGGLNWGDSARSSFKLSRSIARQNQTFDAVFARLADAPESLDARVVTTLAFVDVNASPIKGVELLANWRYEDRDDQTPESRFLAEVPATVGGSFGTAGATGLYKPRSLNQQKGLLEAGWRLSTGYRLSAAVEQEELHRRASSKLRRVAFRERTDEATVRLDLKRTMDDTVNGSLSLQSSRRSGSDYVPDTYDPNALTNQVGAMIWADRRRDKLRLAVDWLPDERLSLQFTVDTSRDSYSGRPLGLRDGQASFASLDSHFRVNDDWSVSSWFTHEHTRSRQWQRSDRVGAPSAGYDTQWEADIRHTTQVLGLGVRGRLRSGVNLGLDLTASDDHAEHGQARIGGSGTITLPTLPGYSYRQQGLKLFAEWPLEAKSNLKFELGFDRRINNDWTWQNWVYNGSPAMTASARASDGTTVLNVPLEKVIYLVIRYSVRWR